MGEVYRAIDPKLKRDVAIKVLPQEFTADQERLARFEREAQLLAQLHHPNIASIFGLEESEGVRALVMELVEGPTLADRLESGSLPIEESLSIARQIAEALEEAHEKGIIHRDLKPQNVKAATEGKVKILDFGLAKAMDPARAASGVAPASASQLAASPTLTLGATVQGVILGTAAYMSPEQAKGMAVDKRADVWAFGVLLYEMLCGGTLFAGDSVGDTLAAVIRAQIDFDHLPVETPPAIRRLLRRCLQRNPKNRLHAIADARIVIDEVLGGTVETPAGTAAPAATRRGVPWWFAAAALAGGLGLGALLFRGDRASSGSAESAPLQAVLEISAPEGTSLVSGLALSPDGQKLAFVARGEDGRTRLWVRPLAEAEARELPGTVDARYPFWAPDGQRIGFFAQNRLRVIDLIGGTPRAVTDTGTAQDVRGGSWGADDKIVFASSFIGPLKVIDAGGGEPEPATVIPEGSGIGTQRFPSFLPDGRRFVYYAASGTGIEPGELYLGRLGSLESKRLGPATSAAQFAAPGYLVYVHGNALVAHRFDDTAEALVGMPMPLGVSLPGSVAVSGQRSLALSASGVLVYRVDKRATSTIVWVDRQGNELGTLASPPDTWHYWPNLSPDGKRLVVSHYDEASTNGSLWIHDLERNFPSRLTTGEDGDNTLAVWSPDGNEIAYSSIRSTPPSGIFRLDLRRPGEERLWVASDLFIGPTDWSAAGSALLYSINDGAGRGSLWVRSTSDEGPSRRLGSEMASEWGGSFSPDGRWVVFQSDVTRRSEIYVRRLDADPGAAVRLSADGGESPAWRRDGKEIFYLDLTGRLIAVPIESLEPLRTGPAVALFEARVEETGDRQYDVTADGQRFLLNRAQGASGDPISVVLGWQERLRGERPR